MKVNHTIFELDLVFRGMTQAVTWDMTRTLKEVRTALQKVKYSMLNQGITDEIDNINTQLVILNKNILTLENALLCHFTKQSERFLCLGDLQLIALN